MFFLARGEIASLHPYVGCRSGCEFCYLRGSHYLGRRDAETFDTLIQVKVNAAELLREELPHLDYETIACGDWQQPAEERYRLSRGMLEVVLDLGLPLFIVERSPLLTRDLDVLAEINRRAWAVDGWPESIADIYRSRGEAGLRELPGIGKSLAGEIARWL